MSSIQALREQRGAKAKELTDLVKKEKWDAAKDQPVYDAGMAEIESIDQQISNLQRLAEKAADETLTNSIADRSAQRGRDENSPEMRAFDLFLRKGVENMTQEELQVFRNTMSTTTGTQGGYTVPTTVATYVTDRLASYGNMRKYATVLPQSAGNDMNFPTSDGTSEEGEIVAQNTAAAAADIAFGLVTINIYKFSSKTVAVPFELLQDSAVDIEAFVGQRLAKRLGRITNRKFTVGAGSGSSEPMGVVTASSVAKQGASGQTTTILYDDIIDMEHGVDVEYREEGNCRYMGHDNTVKAIKKIKDSQGRPLFVPGYADGYAGGFKDTLNGYEIVTNNMMPTPAASAKSLAFGDLSQYVIRDIMDLQMFRFTDSAFTTKGQVGFLAWLRSGGNLVDANAIALYQHAAS